MRTRLVTVAALLVSTCAMMLSVPLEVRASDLATWCKWPFPWPRTATYYIHDFYGDTANRIEYGANTWNGGNFNLILARDYNSGNPNQIYRGPMGPGQPNYLAVTDYYHIGGCSVYPGSAYREITGADTRFNMYVPFHADCLATGNYCAANGYFDLHNLAAHEFGHWSFLKDGSNNSDDTMFGVIAAGEVKKRDLNWHDRESAHAMYGCRNGGGTYWC